MRSTTIGLYVPFNPDGSFLLHISISGISVCISVTRCCPVEYRSTKSWSFDRGAVDGAYKYGKYAFLWALIVLAANTFYTHDNDVRKYCMGLDRIQIIRG